MFSIENGALVRTFAGERLLIEPWGENACGYAVRCTPSSTENTGR
jgi:hypothetical protein